jgi:serine/threonine protein kinase
MSPNFVVHPTHLNLKNANRLDVDFGLSKLRTTASLGSTTSLKGSVRWMAPELLQSNESDGSDEETEAKPTYASDVYSVGMVLWEIGSRCVPFQKASNDANVIKRLMMGKREQLPIPFAVPCGMCNNRTHAPDMKADSSHVTQSKEYTSVIEGCWRKNPEHRFSAEDVAQALQILKKSLENMNHAQNTSESLMDTMSSLSVGIKDESLKTVQVSQSSSNTALETVSLAPGSSRSTKGYGGLGHIQASNERPSPAEREHRKVESMEKLNVEWYACGKNDHGQLGLGHNQEKVLSMTRVCFPVPFVSISMGERHTLALDEKGGVWSWGSNDCSQLGLGHNNDCNAPQKVTYFECTENTTARLIAAAYSHSSVLTGMISS